MLDTRLLAAWVVIAVAGLGAVAFTAGDLHRDAVPPLTLPVGR
jgi:hypothetical protein